MKDIFERYTWNILSVSEESYLKVWVNLKIKVCWEVTLDSQLQLCANVVSNYIEIGKLETMVNVSVILKANVGAKKGLAEGSCISQVSFQENQRIRWVPILNLTNILAEPNNSKILKRMSSQLTYFFYMKQFCVSIKPGQAEINV